MRTETPASRHSSYCSMNKRSDGPRAPITKCTDANRAAFSAKYATTGRKGAKPSPPATIRISVPSRAAATGHVVPNGPRKVRSALAGRSAKARDTGPTARIVWTSVAPRPVPADTLIGTSPSPGKPTMLNWPGPQPRQAGQSIANVATSAVSRRTLVTRATEGTIGSGAMTSARMAIDIQHLQLRFIEPVQKRGHEPL